MDKQNDPWVEERLATLTPDGGWQPDTNKALEKLQERAIEKSNSGNWTWALAAGIACLCLIALSSRSSFRRLCQSLFSSDGATHISAKTAGPLHLPTPEENREHSGVAPSITRNEQDRSGSLETSVAGSRELRPEDSNQATPRIEYIPSEVVASYVDVGLTSDVRELVRVPVPQRPLSANTAEPAVPMPTTPKVAPPPYDPFEPVMTQPKSLKSSDARYPAISLMRRVVYSREFFAPVFEPPFTHAEPGPAYTVKVSFTAGGQAQDGYVGEIDETRNAEGARRWTGHIDGYHLTRIIPESGGFYDQGSGGPLPIRLQMVQSVILGNLETLPDFTTDSIRVANATLHGAALTCILTSVAVTDTPHRDWSEKEYCIDPQSEELRIYSAAPGIYAVYDYGASTPFHDHVVPNQFTVSEAGAVVLRGTINIEDPDQASLDPADFVPSGQVTQGGVDLSNSSAALYVVQFRPIPATSGVIQPVIVHATLSSDGSVIEAETLQASDQAASQSALELVKKTKYAIPIQWHEFSGQRPQGELFATVR